MTEFTSGTANSDANLKQSRHPKDEKTGGPIGIELKKDEQTGGPIGVELKGHCIFYDNCYKIRTDGEIFHLEPQQWFQELGNKFVTVTGTRVGSVITANAIRLD